MCFFIAFLYTGSSSTPLLVTIEVAIFMLLRNFHIYQFIHQSRHLAGHTYNRFTIQVCKDGSQQRINVPLSCAPGTSFYSTWPSSSAREEATTTKWRTYLTSTTSRSQTTRPLTEKARRSVTPEQAFFFKFPSPFPTKKHAAICARRALACFYLTFDVRASKLHHCTEMSLCEMSVRREFYCLNMNKSQSGATGQQGFLFSWAHSRRQTFKAPVLTPRDWSTVLLFTLWECLLGRGWGWGGGVCWDVTEMYATDGVFSPRCWLLTWIWQLASIGMALRFM